MSPLGVSMSSTVTNLSTSSPLVDVSYPSVSSANLETISFNFADFPFLYDSDTDSEDNNNIFARSIVPTDTYSSRKFSLANLHNTTDVNLVIHNTSQDLTFYTYRNHIYVGHLSGRETTYITYHTPNIADTVFVHYPSPILCFPETLTSCNRFDGIRNSRAYSRVLRPGDITKFEGIRETNDLPVKVRHTTKPVKSFSNLQIDFTDIPNGSKVIFHRTNEESCRMRITLPPSDYTPPESLIIEPAKAKLPVLLPQLRTIAQMSGNMLPEEIKADQHEVPFAINSHEFSKKVVHRHMCDLVQHKDYQFWPHLLSKDSDYVIKFAQVCSSVLAEYCDFDHTQFALIFATLTLPTCTSKRNQRLFEEAVWGLPPSQQQLIELLVESERNLAQIGFNLNVTTDFAAILQGLTNKADILATNLMDLKSSFVSDLVPTIHHELRVFIVSLISNIFIIVSKVPLSVRIAACVNVINTLPTYLVSELSSELFLNLIGVYRWFVKDKLFVVKPPPEEENEVRVVAQVESHNPENLLVSLVKIVQGFMANSDTSVVKLEDFRIKRLINLLKFGKFSSTAASFAFELFERVNSIIQTHMFSVPDVDTFYKNLHVDLPEWLRKTTTYEIHIDEVDKNLAVHPLIDLTNYENKLALVRHVQDGERILKYISASDFDTKHQRAVTYLTSKLVGLRKFCSAVGASLVGMQGKHAPFIVYLYGAPGTGKSVCVDFFLKGLFACNGEQFDPSRDKFAKSATTEFWNGYERQKVYLMDDFLQSKASEAHDIAFAEIIALGSRAPYPLNKADVETKGTSYFNSDVVMITAQEKFPDTYIERYIQSSGAFDRRIDVFAKVTATHDYATEDGRVNKEKVNAGYDPKASFFSVNDEHLSFTDFVLHCHRERQNKKARERAMDACELIDIDWLTLAQPVQVVEDRVLCEMFTGAKMYRQLFADPIYSADGAGEPVTTLERQNFDGKTLEHLAKKQNLVIPVVNMVVNPEVQFIQEDDAAFTIAYETDMQSMWQSLMDGSDYEPITEAGMRRYDNYMRLMRAQTIRDQNFLGLARSREFFDRIRESKLFLTLATATILVGTVIGVYKLVSHLGAFKDRTINTTVQQDLDTLTDTIPFSKHPIPNETTKAEVLEFTPLTADQLKTCRKNGVRNLEEFLIKFVEMNCIDDLQDSDKVTLLQAIIRTKAENSGYIPLIDSKAFQNKCQDWGIMSFNNFVQALEPTEEYLELGKEIKETIKLHDVKTFASIVAAESASMSDSGEQCTKKQGANKRTDRNQQKYSRRDVTQCSKGNEHLKLKISAYDDARNTQLLAKLTDENMTEDNCVTCGRYYLFASEEFEQNEEVSCPYPDCRSYEKDEDDRQKLRLNYSSRKDLVAEMALKNRFGLPICESARDPQLMNIMELCRNNMARVKISRTGYALNGIIVEGNVLIFPNHLFMGIEDMSEITLIINTTKISNYEINFSNSVHFIDHNNDVIVMKLDKFPLHRSVVKFFAKSDDRLEYYDSGYLLKITEKYVLSMLSVSNMTAKGKLEYYLTQDPTDRRVQTVDSHYQYKADTTSGDCGSPVFAVNKLFDRKILGFHVAGNTGLGHSNIITQEHVIYLIAKLGDREGVFVEMECEGFYDCSKYIKDSDNVYLLGRVEHGLNKHPVESTSIVKSVLHGLITKPTTAPSLLTITSELNPLRNGIAKSFTQDTAIPSWILDLSIKHLSETISNYKSPYLETTVLNELDTVNGSMSLPYIVKINMDTSPGYPYCLATMNGKRDYFQGPSYEKLPISSLQSVMDLKEQQLRDGLVPLFIIADTLKDERRTLEKVTLGKTRVFGAGPVDMTLLVRKYYGAFMGHMMENHVTGECSVGINCHGDDWGMMFEDAKSVGDYWIAGDYAAYDKKLPYQIMESVADVVNNVCDDGPEIAKIRKGLMASMSSAVHLVDSTLYQTHHGMPSGVPITAIGNSVANSLLFRVAFLTLAAMEFGKEKAEVYMRKFNELIKIKAYGDDHIVRVSRLLPWFNMQTVADVFLHYGLDYTTADKQTVSDLYVREEDLQYLKRKFVKRNGRIFAPLDMNSINEMINWTRKSPANVIATLANCEVALLEMSHYPKAEWDAFHVQILLACKKMELALPFLTYYSSLSILSKGIFDPLFLLAYLQDNIHYAVAEADSAVGAGIIHRRISRFATQKQERTIAQVGSELTNAIDKANSDDTNSTTGITKFSDQSVETVIVNNAIVNKRSNLSVYGSQTLLEFVERPYLVQTLIWKSTSAGTIANLEFPTELFNVQTLAAKLVNFRFLRANLEISFRANASKFHYGKLVACWLPNGLNGLVDYSADKSETSYSGLFSSSACQHVFISPTSNEIQTLKIPYALPSLYIDMVDWASSNNWANMRFNLGLLQIFVLNTLRGAGAKVPDVDISVFARFTDVQLEGYVASPYSVNSYKTTAYGTPTAAPVIDGYTSLGSGFYKTRAPNAAKLRNLAQVGNQEANSKASEGSFSDTLISGAKLVGDIVSVGASIGKALGFTADKPNSVETSKNVIMKYGEYSYSRGVENSNMLAMDPDNRIGNMTEWMGSTDDHMNLASYAGRYALLLQGTIKVTDDAGAMFFCLPVMPTCVAYRKTTKPDAGKLVLYHTPLSYVTNFFTWWRGSIKYKIQIVASAFHAARVRICWHPHFPSNATAPTILETESNVVSHVLDITTDTEFELTIPFLNDDPALSNLKNAIPNGFITMTLMNSLTHANDPVPDVEYNLWVAGGPDMEFFRLNNTRVSTQNLAKDLTEPLRNIAQVGQAIDGGDNETLISSKSASLNNVICGERFTTFADIFKRPSLYHSLEEKIVSYAFGIYSPPTLRKDHSNLLTACMMGFRFNRGSFTIRALKQGDFGYYAKNNLYYFATSGYTGPDAIEWGNFPMHFGAGCAYSPAKALVPFEVTVPYYSSSLFQPMCLAGQNAYVTNFPCVQVTVSKGNTDPILLNGGDDFHLGGIIGPPTLIVTSSFWI